MFHKKLEIFNNRLLVNLWKNLSMTQESSVGVFHTRPKMCTEIFRTRLQQESSVGVSSRRLQCIAKLLTIYSKRNK